MPGTAAIPCPDRMAGIKEPRLAGLKPKGITADAESNTCQLLMQTIGTSENY
jgi:hypothetical protein